MKRSASKATIRHPRAPARSLAPRQPVRRNPDYGGAKFAAYESLLLGRNKEHTVVIFGGFPQDIKAFMRSAQASVLAHSLKFRPNDDPILRDTPEEIAPYVYPGGYSARLFYIVPNTMQLIEQPYVGKRDNSDEQWLSTSPPVSHGARPVMPPPEVASAIRATPYKAAQGRMPAPAPASSQPDFGEDTLQTLRKANKQIEEAAAAGRYNSSVRYYAYLSANRGSFAPLHAHVVVIGGEPRVVSDFLSSKEGEKFARYNGFNVGNAAMIGTTPESAIARIKRPYSGQLFFIAPNRSISESSFQMPDLQQEAAVTPQTYLYAHGLISNEWRSTHVLVYGRASDGVGSAYIEKLLSQAHVAPIEMTGTMQWKPGDYREMVREIESSARGGLGDQPTLEIIVAEGGLHYYPLGKRP